jgi:hypothetical protein
MNQAALAPAWWVLVVPQRVGQADNRAESGIGSLCREETTDDLGFCRDGPGKLGLAHSQLEASFVQATG